MSSDPTARRWPLLAVLTWSYGLGAFGVLGISPLSPSLMDGLLSGVSFAAIVIGLLTGAPLFGAVLEAFDSYGAAWTVFAVAAALVAGVIAGYGPAIHRECRAAR